MKLNLSFIIHRAALLIVLMSAGLAASAQMQKFYNTERVPLTLERISPALRDAPEMPPTEKELNSPFAERENESLERHPQIVNPDALPKGADPALQKNYSHSKSPETSSVPLTVLSTWNGLNAAVDPSDNCMAVGPDHVVQMTNNSTSTYIRVWDKAGTVLVNNKLISSITGINDDGDPNILYDEAADRYVFVLLYGSTAKLLVCVSQTPDPTGAYYVYSFTTANGYPDYPKIGVWDNSYLITTNSNSPTIFALNRATMLAGVSTGTAQVFPLSSFSSLNFQAASPVTQTGGLAPAPGTPATIIRAADDAWSGVSTDHLEIFQLTIDWTTPSNSMITGPLNLTTIPYNSNLCGFANGSCIPQPGTNRKLDPLSDIIMDKAQYRIAGGIESIVCSHVCNADGSGTAGIRWYELRKDINGIWSIFQQSTYAQGTDGRFMSSIAMNDDGTIALGYNISSSAVYPGIRVTGRIICDSVNNMTVPETIIKSGTAANSISRYGDYNGMVTDPTDGSFWFTANYNPSSSWATSVAHFAITECIPTAINNTAEEHSLKIFPNPVAKGEHLNISFSSNSRHASVEIFNTLGKEIYSNDNLKAQGGIKTFAIEASSGIYFVKINEDGIEYMRKLIVE